MWFCCLRKLTHPLGLSMQLLIWEMSFSTSLLIKLSRSSLLWAGKDNTIPFLFLKIKSPPLCHDLVHGISLSFLFRITLIHYTNSTILIGLCEQEVTTNLRHLHKTFDVRGWEINMTKTQGPSTSVKFLGIWCCWECQDTSSKVKAGLFS
jgi:hypothetical protein